MNTSSTIAIATALPATSTSPPVSFSTLGTAGTWMLAVWINGGCSEPNSIVCMRRPFSPTGWRAAYTTCRYTAAAPPRTRTRDVCFAARETGPR